MKTRWQLTLLCTLAAPLVARAAVPVAVLGGAAVNAAVVIRDQRQPHYRVAAGTNLTLTMKGPAKVRFTLRAERGAKAVVVGAAMDGTILAQSALSPVLDDEAISDRGSPVTRPALLAIAVPAGSHLVALWWPTDASADALVSIAGVTLKGKPPGADPAAAALPSPGPGPLPLPLPDPAAPAALGGKPPERPTPIAVATSAPRAIPAVAPPVVPALAAVSPDRQAAAKPAVARSAESTLPSTAARTDGLLFAPREGLSSAGGRPVLGPWSLMLFGGAARSNQPASEGANLTRAGLEVTRPLWVAGLAVLQLDARLSRQTYLRGQPNVPGDLVGLDEYRYDVLAGVGYDFGQLLGVPRLTATPIIGLKYIRIANSAYPANLFGVDLMGLLRYPLSAGVGVHANFGWIYSLVHPAFFSALGAPLGQFGVRAGLDFPLAGGYALALDYQGDVLAFDFSTRTSHGASAGFGKTF